MSNKVSIIYSFRDRKEETVRMSLDSLSNQTFTNFEVVFVDYGSNPSHSQFLHTLPGTYPFVRLISVPSFGKLWSRSKALNIGIRESLSDLIFIVDIDLFFAPNALERALSEFEPNSFFGGNWYFLNQEESKKILTGSEISPLKSTKISDDNGMLLVEKKSLEKIHGYDEFFHLYGGEDTDLKNRLVNAGFKKRKLAETHVFHIWHPHAIPTRPKSLSSDPYAFNVKRINEKHVFYNQRENLIIPSGQDKWGVDSGIPKDQKAETTVELTNIHSRISHFFNFELHQKKGELIHIRIKEASEYRQIKTKLKGWIKGNSEPYMSLQEINEFISETIIYNYRNHPYAYFVDGVKGVLSLSIKV